MAIAKDILFNLKAQLDPRAISRHDLLEMLKQYDYFAKNDRSNFPKTEEQLANIENAKTKKNPNRNNK